MRLFVATCVILASVSGRPVPADEPDLAATVADLKSELAAYDKANGGNTIGIEQDVIRLRDLKATAELAPVLAHKRFAMLAVWALSEIGDPASAAGVIEAFKACADPRYKKEMAIALATFETEEGRAALRAEVEKAKGEDKDVYRAALLRARDAAVEKETLEALEDKDPAKCAAALLLLGDSRREDLFRRFAQFANDTRAVPVAPRSRFRDNAPPELKTVGDCAVEGASRCVMPTTPAMVAWWYESETAPRFVPGAEGLALLAASADAVDASAKAKGLTMARAVAALVLVVRSNKDRPKVRITGIAFTDRWEIRHRVYGKDKTATVDAEGKVSVK